MTVLALKQFLAMYDNNAEVVLVDWSNGRQYEPTVGSDDDDEYTRYCRIGIE